MCTSRSRSRKIDTYYFENWRNKYLSNGQLSIHLVLARLSWVCLIFLVLQTKTSFTRNYPPTNRFEYDEKNLKQYIKHIGDQCGHILDILFENDKEQLLEISKLFSKNMKELE